MEHVRAAFGIGTDLDDLSAVQAVLRTLLIYGATLVLVRLGSKRFLSKASAFDVIIAILRCRSRRV